MAKFNTSKKTAIKKKSLLAILHHNSKIDLNILLSRLDNKKIDFLLIIVDGKFKIKIKNKTKKKIIYKKKSKYAIPINRNIAINFAIKKNYEILFFIDSDVHPNKKLISNHLEAHQKYPEVAAIGGSVEPSSNFTKKFNLWEFLDGKLSWFQAVKNEDYIFVKKPYHLPTCNVSIKLKIIKKNKIKFNPKLFTGEDAYFFENFRKKKLKFLLSSKCSIIHYDRKDFFSFFFHHMTWGRHQYYTLYQSKFPKKFFLICNLIFILTYPLFFIPITFLQSLFVISPWIKLNFTNIFLLPFFLFIHFSKAIFTYLESFKFKYIFK